MSGIKYLGDTRFSISLFTLFLLGGLPWPVSAVVFEDAGSGHIVFLSVDGVVTPAVHLRSSVEVKISGLISRVQLNQQFRNQTDQWQEATYLLPLPADAAVTDMEMQMNNRIVRGEILEKRQAREIYKAAKQSGRKAALAEQARPDLFRQVLANIAPGETINLMLRYVHLANYDDRQFSIRLPLTFTPRYTLEGMDAPLSSSPMVSTSRASGNVHMINPVSIQVSLDSGLPLAQIESPYHDISVRSQGRSYQIALVEGEVAMDRDFLLRWKPETGLSPEAAVFTEHIEGEDYALVMMMPPEEPESLAALPRDIIFVIDTSGSMQGTSIAQAKSGLLKALDTLRPEDNFNIIEFNSNWQRLFTSPQPVDPYYVHQARNWISRLAADGGTEMLPALRVAMDEPVSPMALKHIIFITDGAVGHEDMLFREISRGIGDAHLYPVGIGSAPNSHFMKQSALHGRGSYVHIGDPDEIESRIDGLFRKIDRPLVADISLNWPGNVEQYPQRIPVLYAGEPLLVFARGSGLASSLEVSGVTAGSPWGRSIDMSVSDQHEGIGTIWGRRKIEALAWSEVMGAASAEVRQAIVDVALTHQLVSKYTSLVAVEAVISRLDSESLVSGAVPNLLPLGSSMAHAMYPRTATGMGIAIRAGLVMLLLAAVIATVEVLHRVRWA